MWEALLIIISLGGLEVLLWWTDREELRKQTEILEDIAAILYENGNGEEESEEEPIESVSHN